MKKNNSSLIQHTNLVFKYAVGSRLLMVSLIILWRYLLSPYDTSASINPSCIINNRSDPPPPPKILFPRLATALEESIVWDSVYFIRIAECGSYEYEQTYAFLPLLPISLSLLSKTVFAPLIPLIGHRAVLGFSGYVLNNIAFILAALYLYRLSLNILKDEEISLRAAILFCFNPASVFYSSIYSESLYALLSIGGLYYFINNTTNFATILFALSGFARSNGVLNAGYICFHTMHRTYDAIFLKKHAYLGLKIVIAGALRCIFIFMPFICFQAYGYYNICVGYNNNTTDKELRPWCKARIPLLYNFIQSHYWGVGFLKYFKVKQLPNFLLASPILSLSLCSIIQYVKQWPVIFTSLGFQALPSNIISEKSIEGKIKTEQSVRRRKKVVKQVNDDRLEYMPVIVLPMVLHLGFMVATAFFVMHVQVSTRFLSASPPLYWFASYVMGLGKKKWGYLIWVYCASYIFLGTLLFSNFYPFT